MNHRFATTQAQAEQAKASPFASYQYVTVTFGTANTDLDIVHTLAAPDPDAIDYQVVRADRAVVVYHDASGGRRPWVAGRLTLRANTANAVVDLLLTVRKP